MEEGRCITGTEYRTALWRLAVPVSLQCLLQSSFSVVDQMMIGQLGSVSIAAVGLGGKFISLLTVMVQAIAAVAGIILAQAAGKQERELLSRGVTVNLMLALFLSAVFTGFAGLFPEQVMRIYSEDMAAIAVGAAYLRIYALGFLPMAMTSLLSTYLRCMKEAVVPLYAGICGAVLNTLLNYCLIYGRVGFPALGVQGAAWASVLSQTAGCLLVGLFVWQRYAKEEAIRLCLYRRWEEWKGYLKILLPLFVCELVWVLGENVYGYLYGHMGTQACAAMTLINPVAALMIGALSGIAQAAGIMMGRLLGAGELENAHLTAKRLMKTGLAGAALLSSFLLVTAPFYVRIFQVEGEVRHMTWQVLLVFALICPVKVENMILGGGIIRSGGKTKWIMLVDLIGTWGFGVPLGFLAAFVLGLPIHWVYLLLSLEEIIRLLLSLLLFKSRKWMQQL